MSDAHATAVRTILKSQYHASLAMLREPVDRCSEFLWTDDAPENAYWQVAYHTTFFAHLYMQPSEAAFQPWADHVTACQYPDGIAGPDDPDSKLPLVPPPYTRAQVLAYIAFVDGRVDETVDGLDVFSAESGFSWYKVPKLEHQVINLRHIQHGAAQLADRLRAATNEGIQWVGARRPKTV